MEEERGGSVLHQGAAGRNTAERPHQVRSVGGGGGGGGGDGGG